MKLHISNIKPGMIVDKPIIYDNSNIILLNSGAVLTDKLIERIEKMGIEFIDVDLTNEIITYNVDNELHTTLSKTFVEEAKDSIRHFSSSKITENAKTLVKAIMDSDDFIYSLSEYKEPQDLYSHSIRVAAFSVLLAKHYNDTLSSFINDPDILEKCKIDLEAIAISSMLHDIGKICKNESVLEKVSKIKTNLSRVFPSILKKDLSKYDDFNSSIYSYILLKDNNLLSPDVKMMILLSNEDENGKGPLEPSLNYITSRQNFIFGAKIIKLCSMYDDYLQVAINQNQPFENLYTNLEYDASNGIVNNELEKLFAKHVPLYSKGTKVRLSNGKYAIIQESYNGNMFICKPIVRTIPDNELIDLKNETYLTIEDIVDNQINGIEEQSLNKKNKSA